MTWGPLELVVLTFPDERLFDGVAATLEHLAAADGVRVVDALVVRTDGAGSAYAVELGDLPGLRGLPAAWDPPGHGLVAEADLPEIAASVPPGSDAVAVLVEHMWTARLADRAAGFAGEVSAVARIPQAHADQAIAGL